MCSGYTACTKRNDLRTAHVLVRGTSVDAGAHNGAEARSSSVR
jgi:hypothetical protein